jgi:hypothetical protein
MGITLTICPIESAWEMVRARDSSIRREALEEAAKVLDAQYEAQSYQGAAHPTLKSLAARIRSLAERKG